MVKNIKKQVIQPQKEENKYSSQYILNKWRKDKNILSFVMDNNETINGIIIDFSNYEIVILIVLDINNINYKDLFTMILFKHSISRISSFDDYNKYIKHKLSLKLKNGKKV